MPSRPTPGPLPNDARLMRSGHAACPRPPSLARSTATLPPSPGSSPATGASVAIATTRPSAWQPPGALNPISPGPPPPPGGGRRPSPIGSKPTSPGAGVLNRSPGAPGGTTVPWSVAHHDQPPPIMINRLGIDAHIRADRQAGGTLWRHRRPDAPDPGQDAELPEIQPDGGPPCRAGPQPRSGGQRRTTGPCRAQGARGGPGRPTRASPARDHGSGGHRGALVSLGTRATKVTLWRAPVARQRPLWGPACRPGSNPTPRRLSTPSPPGRQGVRLPWTGGQGPRCRRLLCPGPTTPGPLVSMGWGAQRAPQRPRARSPCPHPVMAGTDVLTLTDAAVTAVQDTLNDRPRKVLGDRTPAEAFAEAQGLVRPAPAILRPPGIPLPAPDRRGLAGPCGLRYARD